MKHPVRGQPSSEKRRGSAPNQHSSLPRGAVSNWNNIARNFLLQYWLTAPNFAINRPFIRSWNQDSRLIPCRVQLCVWMRVFSLAYFWQGYHLRLACAGFIGSRKMIRYDYEAVNKNRRDIFSSLKGFGSLINREYMERTWNVVVQFLSTSWWCWTSRKTELPSDTGFGGLIPLQRSRLYRDFARSKKLFALETKTWNCWW